MYSLAASPWIASNSLNPDDACICVKSSMSKYDENQFLDYIEISLTFMPVKKVLNFLYYWSLAQIKSRVQYARVIRLKECGLPVAFHTVQDRTHNQHAKQR